MKNLHKSDSITSKGLRYRLFVSFLLMAVIPLLVTIYLLSSYVLPHVHDILFLSMIILAFLFTLLLAFLGLALIKKIVEPIIRLSAETKGIANGDAQGHLMVDGEDEIADLGRSINLMTRKIKDYLYELQSYSTKTKEVNIDIQKKVIVLSSLLQISDMIAAAESLDTICKTVVQKAGEIDEDNFVALFWCKEGTVAMTLRAYSNVRSPAFKSEVFNVDKGFIGTSVRGRMTILVDSSIDPSPPQKTLLDMFKAKNCFMVPVVSHGNGIGFLVLGNSINGYRFSPDDIELVKILCKQLGIAYEKAALVKRTSELIVKDELTGLYNAKYIKERLDEEIQRSILYQRPCSLLLFSIDNFKEFRDTHGEMATEDALKKVASILVESSTGINKAARLGGNEFAVVLSETNKKQAAVIAEQMRKNIERMGLNLAEKGEQPMTVTGSVSENPLDGSSSKELFAQAAESMISGKETRKNCIYS